MLEPAGDYTVGMQAGDGLEASDAATLYIHVEAEEASVRITDFPSTVGVKDAGGDSRDFRIRFTLSERDGSVALPSGSLSTASLGPMPGAASTSELAGNIGLADFHLVLGPVGPGGEQEGECMLESGDDLQRTIACDFTDLPVNTYAIQVSLNGDYYTGSDENVLTVFDPSLGFTTGGGWFYWPGTQDKTNFGFHIDYTKKGTNVKGGLLLVRHLADGTSYRVKSNAMESLAVGEAAGGTFGWATATGKATYSEPLSDPLGNHAFTFYVEDRGQTGDRLWIELTQAGALVPAMSLSGAATASAQAIEEGSITVPHRGEGRGR
jgi:hypothetical protein